MTRHETILQEKPDMDTMGGRLARAREALGLKPGQLARQLGVKAETMDAWENDRSEPRANRLIMLAGLLGVSPTWLLTGVGEAPSEEQVRSELHVAAKQLGKLKEHHDRAGELIAALEDELSRLTRAAAE